MKITAFLDDILLIVGFLFILRGLAMLSIPIAWIVAGFMFIFFGVLVAKGNNKNVVDKLNKQ